MKLVLLALSACFLMVAPASAQTTCSEANARCLTPRGGGMCDVNCLNFCKSQMKSCRKTGSFRTFNHSWEGLKKS